MQRETLFELGFIAISSTVLLTVAAGCLSWVLWFAGRSRWNLCGDRSNELITRLPQTTPRFELPDFIVMFGVLLFVSSLMMQSASRTDQSAVETIADQPPAASSTTGLDTQGDAAQAPPQSSRPVISTEQQLQIHFSANLMALVFTLAYLRVLRGATLQDLTLVPSTSDLRRGAIATVWILAPVLIINLLIAMLREYSHTVMDMLSEDKGLGTFAFLFLSAAILTPIVEEIQFRLLLQGGLQRWSDASPATPPGVPWSPIAAWPVVATSLLFAAMHLGQGAAPIPLFFLSMGLGFLYQRTGRLVPAIVVHMLLNGATLSMEYCRLNAGIMQ